MLLQGRYADGKTAALQEVAVRAENDELNIVAGEAVLVRWPCAQVRRLSEDSRYLVLGLADGSLARLRLSAADGDMIRSLCPALRSGLAIDRAGRRQLLVWGVAAIAGLAMTYFLLLPAIAMTVAEVIPAHVEQRIGRRLTQTAVASLNANGKLCRNDQADASLAHLLDVLTRNQPSRLPLEIQVVDHPMVNAFALPGGQLLIMRGLLDFVQSDAELAAVLAHEIAHVDARHNLAGAVHASAGGLLIGFVFGDVIGGIGVASAANYLLTAGYSREVEAEADRAAALRLRQAQINPKVAAGFFERLAKIEGEVPAVLSTHPPSPERKTVFIDNGQPSRPLLTAQQWRALVEVCRA